MAKVLPAPVTAAQTAVKTEASREQHSADLSLPDLQHRWMMRAGAQAE